MKSILGLLLSALMVGINLSMLQGEQVVFQEVKAQLALQEKQATLLQSKDQLQQERVITLATPKRVYNPLSILLELEVAFTAQHTA